MQIGEVIRKYRKNKNMTQEDMAKCLGVTTPAESFEAVFQYAKSLIQQYPNCNQLIWQLAVIMDARCMMDGIANPDVYDKQILEWYQRALENGDAKVQRHCADSLFGYYTRKEMYDKAEGCLDYFEEGSVEKKRMQAVIYSKTNRIQEAYKTYEEILFSNYQMLNMVLGSLYMLSMQEGDIAQARKYIEKESGLAKLFEMGIYYETSCKLELAALEKNVPETLSVVKTMLASLGEIGSFMDSFLYYHLTFNKKSYSTLVPRMREDLLECFRDDETFGYMAGNEEWEMILL